MHRKIHLFAVLAALAAAAGAGPLDFVDPLIGTEGQGTQYGGMQPYTCVPFGSFHLVPMTRTNRIGRLSFNSADENLLGFILTVSPPSGWATGAKCACRPHPPGSRS